MRAGVVVTKPVGETTPLSNLILTIFCLLGSVETLMSVMLPANAACIARLKPKTESVLIFVVCMIVNPLNVYLCVVAFSVNSVGRKVQLP